MRDDRLVATHRRHDDVIMTHRAGDDFVGSEGYFHFVHFTRGGNGHVSGLMLSSGRVRNLRFVRRDP